MKMQIKNISSSLVFVMMALLTLLSCKKETATSTQVVYQEENQSPVFLATTGLNLIATSFSNQHAIKYFGNQRTDNANIFFLSKCIKH